MAVFVDNAQAGGENQGAANLQVNAGQDVNRAVAIAIAYWDDGATRSFTITAGGVSAGQPVRTVGNANDGQILYYVITGVPTGQITVSITPSQNLAEGFYLVSSWDRTPQENPVVDSAIIAGNTGQSITIPTMSVGEDEVGVGALYYYVAGASNPVASDTAMGTPVAAGISRATHQRGDGTLGWTGLGTGGGSMAVGIVLGHDDGAAAEPPAIDDVDGDNTITSAQTGVVISGSAFSAATVEIRQGDVVVEQTVTAQDEDEITFNVVFDLSPDPSLRYGAATLAVINDDEQEDTVAISIVPPAGQFYVDVVDPVQDPDQALTADPAAATGDQVHIRGVGGGAAPAGLTVNPNMTFEFDPEAEPEAFEFRFLDASDATWGDWAERGVLADVDLIVAAASHGHSVDSLLLLQANVLTVQGAAHGQSAAAVNLTQASVLAPAGAAHDQAADAVELVQAHVLAAAGAAHGHTAGGVELVAGGTLSPADSAHAHEAEEPDLTQDGLLAPDGASHGHAAESPALTQAHILAAAGAMHAHAADSPELLQANLLAVQSAVHDHAAGNVVLVVAGALQVADSAHAQTAAAVELVQASQIDVSDAAHGHASTSVTLSIATLLQVADALHAHGVDGVALAQAHVIVVADALQAHAVPNVVLQEAQTLDVQGAVHGHAAEDVEIWFASILAVASSVHEHEAGDIELTQRHVLIVSSALHQHLADRIGLRLPGLVPPSKRVFVVPTPRRTYVVSRGSRKLQ